MKSNLEPGAAFGSYRIEGFIAAGGMGQVYAARHAVYGTAVAMKVLHADLHADAGWRRRFDIEGLVGTQLKHPHLLSARELVEDGGRVALVIDLVFGGQTLLKVVTREFATGVPLVGALQVFLCILQGVEYAHTKSIVHGDLKPENVLLSGDFRDPNKWVPLVTDFGTVALIAHPVTIDGQVAVVASPRYASPEHMYGVDHLEKRSDIYALGLILHFLLTGRHVSDARTVQEASERVVKPIPLALLVDQPESIIAIVQRACAVKPADRFASCRELALAVRKILDERGVKLDLEDLAAELATELIEERPKMKAGAIQDRSGASSEPTLPMDPPAPPVLEQPMKDADPSKNPLWGSKIDLSDEEDAPTARLTPDRVGANLWGEDASTPAPVPTERLNSSSAADSSSAAALLADVATEPPASERAATPAEAPRAQQKRKPRTDVVTIPEFAPPESLVGAAKTARPSQLDTAPSMERPSLPKPDVAKPSEDPTITNAMEVRPGAVKPAGGVPVVAWVVGALAVLFLAIVLVYAYSG